MLHSQNLSYGALGSPSVTYAQNLLYDALGSFSATQAQNLLHGAVGAPIVTYAKKYCIVLWGLLQLHMHRIYLMVLCCVL